MLAKKRRGAQQGPQRPSPVRFAALGCHIALIEIWSPFVTEKGPSEMSRQPSTVG
jgi:hypothetical protein